MSESLDQALERIRQSLCPYPYGSCDCKLGAVDLPSSGTHGEKTGCPELRRAIAILKSTADIVSGQPRMIVMTNQPKEEK